MAPKPLISFTSMDFKVLEKDTLTIRNRVLIVNKKHAWIELRETFP